MSEGRNVCNTAVARESIPKIRFKGSLTRDFRLQVFFMNQCPSGWGIPLEPFFSKICRDIRKLMFITGVLDTGDKLFSGVKVTGEKVIASVLDTGEKFIFPPCH
jgi:hypothetical protein